MYLDTCTWIATNAGRGIVNNTHICIPKTLRIKYEAASPLL